MAYYSYVLRSIKNGILYKGSTENSEQRLKSHNSGMVNFTSKHLPWELVLFEEFTRTFLQNRFPIRISS